MLFQDLFSIDSEGDGANSDLVGTLSKFMFTYTPWITVLASLLEDMVQLSDLSVKIQRVFTPTAVHTTVLTI